MQGQNVTLSCSTKYYHKLTAVPPPAKVKASQEWDSAAGAVISSTSHTPVTVNNVAVGETLQTDVWTIATGTKIPSYNCTSMFDFHDFGRSDVATNYVSWTCVSEPVLVWCTYVIVLCKQATFSFTQQCSCYRAMLYIARTTLSQDVRPSVCLFVTIRNCIKKRTA